MSTPEPEPQLSPPWYTLRNQIAATIGNDPSVRVSELDRSQQPLSGQDYMSGITPSPSHCIDNEASP